MASDLIGLCLYAVRAITNTPEKDALRAYEPEQSAAQADQGGGRHYPQHPANPGADE